MVGYWGLFLASFLSATILPFSSEALLCGMIIGGYDIYVCIAIATLGNWIGSMSTYFLGYVGDWNRIERWLKIDQSKTSKYIDKVRRFGYWAGTIVWLPGIGDVICVCMGLVRTNILKTTIAIFAGKLLRYIVIGYLVAMGSDYYS